MSYVLKITNYYMVNSHRINIIIVALGLLAHMVLSIAVDKLIGTGRDAGMVTPIALLWIFTFSIVAFSRNFEYLLCQGITRKRFFRATVFTLAVVSAVYALLLMIYWAVGSRVIESTGMLVLYEGLYHNQNLLSMLIWEFSLLFLLCMTGWFVSLVFYVSSARTKIIIYSSIAVLIPLSIAVNNLTDGSLFRSIARFIGNILGLAPAVLNPYIAVGSLLAITAIISGAIFLLLRRAQISNSTPL